MTSEEPKGIRRIFNSVFSTNGRIFFVCLALSGVLWMLTSLNESYSTSVNLRINYQNKPEGKVYVKPLPQSLSLTVKGKGWDLLGLKIRGGFEQLNVNLLDHKWRPYIHTRTLRFSMQQQLSPKVTVSEIYPDTISLEAEKKLTRKLPVKLNYKLSFGKQFELGGFITSKPDSIVVTGPASVVSRLKAVGTDLIDLDGLEKETRIKVELVQSPQHNIQYQQNEVTVFIPVYQLSEQTVELPVEIINPKFGGDVKLIPEKVNLTYQTTLNRFKDIKAEQFQAVVDGSQVDTSQHQLLRVQIITQPDFTYHLRLKEEYVDYVINK
ncbi:MAG: YbbR-like domain-containing protein [Bacteroidota bacterium]|nr:YbbR-like domain-containing protein [Bacteroidota bacterium]